MTQLQPQNVVTVLETNLLEQVLANTVQRQQEVMKPQKQYAPVRTFITEPQKKYITHLRDEARKVGLHTLADRKVSNRKEASDYIGLLLKSIREEKAKPKPAPKPCGCGMRK